MSGEQSPNARTAIEREKLRDVLESQVRFTLSTKHQSEPAREVVASIAERACDAMLAVVDQQRDGWERDARQAERDRIRGDLDSMTRRVPSSMGGAGMPLAAPRAPDWECYYNVYDVREKLLDGEQR